ncbi:MAG: spore germination protein [Lachnospiraceae bacterium]|nr:spore germination protein [Lachnospiraceae bacterium]
MYDEQHRIDVEISKEIDKNIAVVDSLFENCGDMVKKTFTLRRGKTQLRIYLVYIDGLVNSEMVERTVLHPLMYEWRSIEEPRPFQNFLEEEIESVDIQKKDTMEDAVAGVLKGDTSIFVDGYDKVIILSSKSLPVRSIDQAPSEQGTRGARDGFNESIRTSTALLRRRIKDPKLKILQNQTGQRSRSEYAICYMEGMAKPELIEKIQRRMESFDIDALFDSGMLEHLLSGKWYSPFPLCQSTERPDKAASALLEGRVVIILDNSPEVLIVPVTFPMFFQAADDYYNQWWVASFARVLRFLAMVIAIGLPGFYVALTCFHTEVLPTELLLAISSARTAVTFPVLVEVLLMEFLFELLREAGIRLPGQMGNTIGVVGGLIVGQSAVDAHLVSTIVVIVVALAAIAAFCIPNEAFASAFRLMKFFLIIMGGIWGFYGFLLGMLVLAIHMSNLDSFGTPYMMPAVGGQAGQYDHIKDYVLRFPIRTMKKRPIYTEEGERVRLRSFAGKQTSAKEDVPEEKDSNQE